jgi:alpha-tubulin suppressor-like RCC1 family protein
MKSRILSIILTILSVVLFSQIGFAQSCAKLVNVSIGDMHMLALDARHNLWACGAGALGLGDVSGTAFSLRRVLDGEANSTSGYFENVISFDAGEDHSLAVTADGFCWSFGDDAFGKLGNGPNRVDSSVPIKVHGLGNDSNGLRHIVKVSAGRSGQHSLAVDSNGYVYAWGCNESYQCGDNSNTNRQSPVLVWDSNDQTENRYLGDEAFIIDIDAGTFHSLALSNDGFVYEWGNYYNPRKVPGLSNIVDIATCNDSLAADSNGNVWYWTTGNNPTKVNGLSNIKKVAAGSTIFAALDSNGNVWEWTTIDSPVKVTDGQQNSPSGDLEDIIALDVGLYNQRVAIDSYGFGWGWGSILGIGNIDVPTVPTEMLCADYNTPPADIAPNSPDGVVNFLDFAVFANAWETHYGDLQWNIVCDLVIDHIIDYDDLAILASEWLSGATGQPMGSPPAPSLYLVYDGNITPDPNTEITIQVHTDTPLLAMGMYAAVAGDANITTAMSTADCNQYGWDPEWSDDPNIDPNGLVYINGGSWDADANDIVGYFKFIYNSGTINIAVTADSFAYDANCEPVAFSTDPLIIGYDPNLGGEGMMMSMPEGFSAEQMDMSLSSVSEVETVFDINEILNWLDDLWQSGDLAGSMTQEEYLEFRETVENSGE